MSTRYGLSVGDEPASNGPQYRDLKTAILEGWEQARLAATTVTVVLINDDLGETIYTSIGVITNLEAENYERGLSEWMRDS